ncbi:MAG: zinc-binding dehydrogenase [Clostridiales Family XIII bacterium]|jgi:threonine dehydrogenase-like Zn-dependent dehydrogenase|nr:zinc-binding dehydrogenase [Clostridiales Family XIII bacterium]
MSKKTYRAAIYHAAGDVKVEEKEYPVCGDNDVIIKNLMAGVCGSDIGSYQSGGEAHMIYPGDEFGHEMISEVVEVGKNVTCLKVGDHVFPNMGFAHRSFARMASVGGFSEYLKILDCEEGYSYVRIPDDLPLKEAVLFEPFVIGTRGAAFTDPGPGRTAIVFGAGIIGMSAAIMLRWYGCDKVMIADIAETRLERARSFGILTVNTSEDGWKDKVIAEFGAGEGFGAGFCNADILMDCAGVQPVVDSIASLAKRGATIGIVGVHHEPVTMDFVSLCYNSWMIKGCGVLDIFDAAKDIFAMMKSGKYQLASLVSHEYPLERICDAIEMAGTATEAQKVVIRHA